MHPRGRRRAEAGPLTKKGVPKKTPLPRLAVEALRNLPSYGVDEYVSLSSPTAKRPDPKKLLGDTPTDAPAREGSRKTLTC
jgi:hypothetical protein